LKSVQFFTSNKTLFYTYYHFVEPLLQVKFKIVANRWWIGLVLLVSLVLVVVIVSEAASEPNSLTRVVLLLPDT
jgi:hypothetical protein